MLKFIQKNLIDTTRLTPEEKWEKATITNNFIFYKIMQNNHDVCKELLEILLKIKIDHIEMHNEEIIEIDYGKKGIRLDVYAVGTLKAFDLEMQATDTGELPERARFYQTALDVSELNSGQTYKELKDSYIVFICIPDIFGKGLAKYTFENLCMEDSKIKLNDRTYKYFFIAENCGKINDVRQKSFLKLLSSNKNVGTDAFADKIAKLVEEAKHNTEWRRQYMEFERYMTYSFREGKEEGLLEGSQKKAEETAVELLKENISPEIIAKCVKLPIEKVIELQESIKIMA